MSKKTIPNLNGEQIVSEAPGTINTKNLLTTAKGLTQAHNLGMIELATTPVRGSVAHVFTETISASFTGTRPVAIGAGTMNADDHSAIVAQIAQDKGRTVSEVANEYLRLIGALGRGPDTTREIIITLLGSGDKPVEVGKVGAFTPTRAAEVLTSVITRLDPPTKVFDGRLFQLLGDLICHCLAPFGWVVRDAYVVVDVKRSYLFPSKADLVGALEQKELSRILTVVQRADMTPLKRMVDRPRAMIAPLHIASQISNALARAYDQARRTYDAASVVDAVLDVLAIHFDMAYPDSLLPSPRVLKATGIAELSQNLAIFLITQEHLVGRKAGRTSVFSDEEIASELIPQFRSALVDNSLFKIRTLSDVVAPYGKMSTKDQHGLARKVSLYEQVSLMSTVEAFTPSVFLRNSEARFLDVDAHLSTALESAFKPIATFFDIEDAVTARMEAYAMAAPDLTNYSVGADIFLGFATLHEQEILANLPAGSVSRYWASVDPSAINLPPEVSNPENLAFAAKICARTTKDVYTMMLHLACAPTQGVEVRVASLQHASNTEGRQVLALQWVQKTNATEQLGSSSIVYGDLVTFEPLESLVYASDFKPTGKIVERPLGLADQTDNVHMWDWRARSRALSYPAIFLSKIEGVNMTIELEEYEMLAMGSSRKESYYIRPVLATAVVRLWAEWIEAEAAFVARGRRASEPLVAASFSALQNSLGLQLVTKLATIGYATVGTRVAEIVRDRIRILLAENGKASVIPSLYVGYHDAKLHLWSGVQVLGLFGLLDAELQKALFKTISNADALTQYISLRKVAQGLTRSSL